ncbi:MAG: peptide chain release factor N(5)-glutamine methyltransferase [Pseudomonadota bacterium]
MAAQRLRDAGIDAPEDEARKLARLAVPKRYVDYEKAIAGEGLARFNDAVARRCAREPFSHISGQRYFWKGAFRVTADVLDPRPETETLVELALQEPFTKVLDLGTGSGCIIISLLSERLEAHGVGTDISERAILIAGENAYRNEVAERLVLPVSDWFEDVGGRYDLIVSNPPYIALDEMDGLDPEVRDYEPREALTDEADGLSAYRIIARHAPDHLKPCGRVLVEIGPTQAPAVTDLFCDAGLEDVRLHPDLDGRDRVVSARAAR